MSGSVIKKDVVIIGAGPSGLFAVFECGMLGLKCAVFDALAEIGGQCTALYPEKPIYDIPGFPSVLAGDLIAYLEAQAAPFAPEYHMNQQVVSVSKESSFWHIKSSKGVEVEAQAIIIAAGAGAFGPNRPPLQDIEKYEGTSVFYMVRRKEDFRGKRIVIAGGGDSAVDWALSLAPIAEKLYVVHRRDKFRAAPESVRQMDELKRKGQIEIIVPYQLHEIKGRDNILTEVVVSTMEGAEKILPADILLPFFGLAAELGPLAEWGLAIDQKHIAVDYATCQTSTPGIYAIGDIAAYKSKLKLILTGFNEAALTAHAIHRQIFPDKELHFEYSTTKGLPGTA
jgi:thioredoxin reductase (NADPH)